MIEVCSCGVHSVRALVGWGVGVQKGDRVRVQRRSSRVACRKQVVNLGDLQKKTDQPVEAEAMRTVYACILYTYIGISIA